MSHNRAIYSTKREEKDKFSLYREMVVDLAIKRMHFANISYALQEQKRFYNRETIPFIKISLLTESLSTLLWLVEILELKKVLIIWVS